jgi:predicted DNA-binding WGR domain protein
MEGLQRFTRYGEKKAGVNNKFYEVEAIETEEGRAEWIFRWGRIGGKPQEKRGRSGSFRIAKNKCIEQFKAKEKRGYSEVNAMEALASAVEDLHERKTNGMATVEIAIPRFHAGSSEKRCTDFCQKWLDKLNLVRASRWDLGSTAYRRQIEGTLKGYCKEWMRIHSSKAHGHLEDNAAAHTAFRIFFKAMRDDAGIHVYGYFEGVGTS